MAKDGKCQLAWIPVIKKERGILEMNVVEEKDFYSIKQAADYLGVETYLLRYWEDELGIKILRTDTGRRIYNKQDLIRFQKIIEYRKSGMKLKNLKEKINQLTNEEVTDEKEKNTAEYVKEDDEQDVYLLEEKLKEKIENNKKIIIEKNKNNFSKNNNKQKKINKIDHINSNNRFIQNKVKSTSLPEVIESETNKKLQKEYEQNEKMNKLQELLSKAFQNALEESTVHVMNHMCTEVRDTVTKEIDYQFRMRDEKEEKKEELRRMKEEEWMKSQEEHFRLLDEMLRAGTMNDRRKKKLKKENKKVL